tara:strand:- start:311 stop:727 length:417 start_codon:yes stop_codon:yes gene_type:complete
MEPGSSLPESKWATYGVYLEAFQLGLVDRIEVLKKNPEIFDKESLMARINENEQLKEQVGQLTQQIEQMNSELEKTTKEKLASRERVQLEKFKSRLSEIQHRVDADRRVNRANLQNTVLRESERVRKISEDIEATEGA